MATRAFNQPPTTSPVKMPRNLEEWASLMRKAIERAETTEDRRIHGLRKALVDGNSERHLRLLGIISEACIHREFPEKDK